MCKTCLGCCLFHISSYFPEYSKPDSPTISKGIAIKENNCKSRVNSVFLDNGLSLVVYFGIGNAFHADSHCLQLLAMPFMQNCYCLLLLSCCPVFLSLSALFLLLNPAISPIDTSSVLPYSLSLAFIPLGIVQREEE